MQQLLLITIALPLIGAALISLQAGFAQRAVRWTALGVTLVTLVGALVLVANYPAAGLPPGEFFAPVDRPWLGQGVAIDVRLSLGLDGLSVWLFALSALLMVSSVLVSWEAIDRRPGLFYGMLLLLEFGCLGVFAARDIMLFYVFFEFTLIPLFFLIGIWGSEDRRYAAIKFFLFTLAGSLLTFVGLLVIVFWAWGHDPDGVLTFSIPRLTAALAATPMPAAVQLAVFLALFAGFAIKVPLFPLHTWLPLAHVQAPTAGSVILAGILLKIGTYGFLRFNVPMLPQATASLLPWLLWLSVGGILFGALVALAQSDIKRLIAYSSVSHLGFCMLGMFAINRLGLQGAVLQMVNHGISTGALFALVGMIYERWHTRQISELGGLARRTPILLFFFVLFTMSSIGLPGMNGFAGEFLILLGMFQRGFAGSPPLVAGQFQAIAVLSVFGVVLGAWYMLWLVQRIGFGPLHEPHEPAGHGDPAHAEVRDLGLREVAALVPLAVLVFWIGLVPRYFLDRVAPSLTDLGRPVERYLMQVQDPVVQAKPGAPGDLTTPAKETFTRAD